MALLKLPRLPFGYQQNPDLFKRYWDEAMRNIETAVSGALLIPGIQELVDTKLSQAAADLLYEPLGGAGGNVAIAQVDFGLSGYYAETTVTASWASPNIVITPTLPTTPDHDPEDAVLEGLVAGLVAVDPGVSFTIGVHAPTGTWGRFDFSCIGA